MLKVIRHEKLNTVDNPCNPSPDYNFANCVERSVVAKVGCQPPWRRFTMQGVPQCDNWSQLSSYGKQYGVRRADINSTVQILVFFREFKILAGMS